MDNHELEYAGFWLRLVATIIDTILLMLVTLPLGYFVYGSAYFGSEQFVLGAADVLINWVLPAIAIVLFWIARGQTPGKMAIGARIVDAATGGPISPGQAIVRYVGYFVSLIGLFIGYLWVGFDPKKQGWHDHIARTVEIRKKGPESVTFGKG